MSTQSDSDGSKEEYDERFQLAEEGEGRDSKEMSAKLAAKELETLQARDPSYIKSPAEGWI